MPAVTRLSALPIRLRLALWFAAFLLVSVLGTGALFLSLLEFEVQREIDDSLLVRASRVERELAGDGRGPLDPHNLRRELLELSPLEEFALPGIYVQVMDRAGRVLAASASLGSGQLPVTPDLLQAEQPTYQTLSAGAERVRVLVRPLREEGQLGGFVIVGESLHLLDATQRSLRQVLVVAALAVALVVVGVSWWLTGRALRPIREVSRMAHHIRATNRFDQRLAEPFARDELRELTVTFNHMLDRLEQTFTRQREFLADASHELRGPLMIIRGNLNLLARDPPRAERQEAVRDAAEEAARVSRLVDDLLFLAEVDTAEVIRRQPVQLDEVVAEVVERAARLDGGAHELAVETQPAVVPGDPERLSQMAWNLVDNALKYTPPGGRVAVRLDHQGPRVALVVQDTGVGISAEHLPHLFERFYRVDRARSRTAGGVGLGLAIVKQIVEVHGGSVEVRSQPGQGAVFTVTLPADQGPASLGHHLG